MMSVVMRVVMRVVKRVVMAVVVPMVVPLVMPQSLPEAVTMDAKRQPCKHETERSRQYLLLASTLRHERLGESAHQKSSQIF